MRINTKTTLAAAGLTAALLAGNALAAVTTLTGSFVSYSFDTDDLGLFGAASLSGDELVFTPTNFVATSANGSTGSAIQTLHVTVSANSGYLLSAFSLSESGSYGLTGIDATAFVTGTFGALDTEGTTGNYLPVGIAPDATLDGTGGDWTASAGIILPGTGWGGDDGVVTSVKLTISNQLFATSILSGESAEVWKNAVAVNVVTSPVPEAETYAMILAGLGLVGFMARRRSLSVI